MLMSTDYECSSVVDHEALGNQLPDGSGWLNGQWRSADGRRGRTSTGRRAFNMEAPGACVLCAAAASGATRVPSPASDQRRLGRTGHAVAAAPSWEDGVARRMGDAPSAPRGSPSLPPTTIRPGSGGASLPRCARSAGLDRDVRRAWPTVRLRRDGKKLDEPACVVLTTRTSRPGIRAAWTPWFEPGILREARTRRPK